MRKILICDHTNVLESSYEITKQALRSVLGKKYEGYEIVVHGFIDEEDLIRQLEGVEGLITAFLPIGESILSKAKSLRCISISGVGYGNIDCQAAKKYRIAVCHIKEYCTQEVAEHTMALMSALNRNLKYYTNEIEQKHQWTYHTILGGRTLSNQTLAIYGFGRIGKRVAKLALGFGMKVLVVDHHTDFEFANSLGVEVVSEKEALERADVISNHMNLTKQNYHYFSRDIFLQMKRRPIFINVGRGASVKESDLLEALEQGWIRGAGLDVLEEEKPDLANSKLLARSNVIITPHSAFYSEDSMEALQRISGENLGYYLSGEKSKLFELVPECTEIK